MASEQTLIKLPPDPRDLLSGQLLEIIARRGYTQTELAQRTFLSESYLSRVCTGKRYPSLYALISLLKECGCELKITELTVEAPRECL
jgi:transcriptional regulator with XRE-family HTH domain